jgi:cell division protein FtsB
MKTNARRSGNALQLSKIFGLLSLAAFIGAAGLCYVSLKNTQHALGEQVLKAERQLKEIRLRNQDLASRITRLSSRTELRRQIELRGLVMIPIKDNVIARLTPPAIATDDGVLRTAANSPILRQ